MNIISAASPQWANEAQTAINLQIEVDGLGVIPFTATPTDTEPHGRALFAAAVAGDYGSIAPETPPPAPAPEQIIASLTAAVQAHLDATARARNYDGILSLCSYAASVHPKFGADGLAGVAWRDAVWASCYAILADVQAGNRTVPTAAELLAELPAMVWPA